MSVRTQIRGVAAVLALVAGAAAWHALAPVELGGSKRYVVIQGRSMEPGYRSGDVVVLLTDGDYAIGEVAMYDSGALGDAVLHRIVGRSGGRLVFKGDNNAWIDRERPRADRIRGEVWLRLPGLASALRSITEAALPFGAALVVGVGAALGSGRARRRGRHAVPPVYAPAHAVGPPPRRSASSGAGRSI